MSWLAWIAGLGPVFALAIGWLWGYGQANAASAGRMGRLENEKYQKDEQIRVLRNQVAALSAADMSDADFERLLDSLSETGTDDIDRVLVAVAGGSAGDPDPAA